MLRGAGVERVGRQRLAALKQSESGTRHHQMEITGPGAYRAVAFRGRKLGWSVHLEPDTAAVAAPGMKNHVHAAGEENLTSNECSAILGRQLAAAPLRDDELSEPNSEL